MSTQGTQSYDLILVGTGFSSTFFLKKFLSKAGPSKRILVLERGGIESLRWKIANRSAMQPHGVVSEIKYQDTYINETPQKQWVFNVGFGGGSNVWWGCTPRFMPNDFKLRSTYGVGTDWPIGYSELEEYYEEAEKIMLIAGSDSTTPFPKRSPYPQPAHKFNAVDKLLERENPGLYFPLPAARARIASDKRSRCCASGVCNLCPVDAKFTIENSLNDLYRNTQVELITNAQVLSLDLAQGLASKIFFKKDGRILDAKGEIFVLGANPIFNSEIMLRSGDTHPMLGRFLSEQRSISVRLQLSNLANYQGSTSITGHGYMLYEGSHRKDRAACLIENWNVPRLQMKRGKYTHTAELKFIFEELPELQSQVKIDRDSAPLPTLRSTDPSDYLIRSRDYVRNNIEHILRGIPIEKLHSISQLSPTEGHILGTHRMSSLPHDGVVDSNCTHHSYRNLFLLGGGCFPTTAPANPTLTIAALALRACERGTR